MVLAPPDRAERRLQSLLKRLFLSAADTCAAPSLRIRPAVAIGIRAARKWGIGQRGRECREAQGKPVTWSAECFEGQGSG